MPDIAFVVFDEDKNSGRQSLLIQSGFLKSFTGMAIFRYLYGKSFESGIRVIKFAAVTELLSIRLPFPQSSIVELNQKYLTGYISRICSENGCVRCFLPSAVKWPASRELVRSAAEIRQVLFRELLLPVLNEIYTIAGIRLDSLDIAFVCGDGADLLPAIVRKLEPFVKYINVASPDREQAESSLAEICSDSGLSIFISGDYSSILRNADLVINLGKPGILTRYRIKPHTLVINFYTDHFPIPYGEFQIINGVEFTFPDEKFAGFDEDILRNYTKAELTEILLASEVRMFDENDYDRAAAGAAADAFADSGCRISGFAGRRGIQQPGSVRKALGLYC